MLKLANWIKKHPVWATITGFFSFFTPLLLLLLGAFGPVTGWCQANVLAVVSCQVFPIPTPTLTPTPTIPPIPTDTPSPTIPPIPTLTPSPTISPIPTIPTDTATATATPTNTLTSTSTATNTLTPTISTDVPTLEPTLSLDPKYLRATEAVTTANSSGYTSLEPLTWTPYTRQDDNGVVIALVPAGYNHESNYIEPFWMDVLEVTYEQYNQIIQNQSTAIPGLAPVPIPSGASDASPITRFTWFQARDYCRLRGGELPSDNQWRYAANGPGALRDFPWGDASITLARAVTDQSVAQEVGLTIRSEGASWVGALDILGNVSEWANSSIASANVWGGSYGVRAMDLTLEWYTNFPREYFSPNIGFRCVFPFQQSQ